MWDPWADARNAESLRGRLRWFLLGRVAIISCFLIVIGALHLWGGPKPYAVPVNFLLGIIVGTYVFSVVSALLLERIHRLGLFSHVQIGFDILLISGVILLTGGVDSPFPFLYSLPILNSAGLLLRRGALLSALMSAAAYDALVLALAQGWIAVDSPFTPSPFSMPVVLRFVATNLSFFLVAVLAGFLAERLGSVEAKVREEQVERQRLALLQETLARTVGSGVISTDPDGRVTSVNQTAETLTGLPAGELIGRDIGAIFPPLQLTSSARLRFLQSTGAAEPIEFSHETAPGHVCHFRCVAAPLKNTYAHPIGALYVLQDITELKKLETQNRPVADIEALCRDSLTVAEEIVEATDGLYGISHSIQRVREIIQRVASSDATVLISGESGTGKELVARSIHAHSPRRDRPFVAINCGAIPETLIESELFGHVRGAFTGAVADRAGCFRAADTGTIFLDEVGDLPLPMQVKLLRVLQERVFRPVGSETNVAVNVRVLAATNKNLQEEVKNGRFREDLFYRLNVIRVELPPLRERREDIPLLIRHFLRQYRELHGRSVMRFSAGAGKILLSYNYPGNIRELENIIEHAVALCEGDTATEQHLPAYVVNGSRVASSQSVHLAVSTATASTLYARPTLPPLGQQTNLDENLAEYEKTVILHALEMAGGVKKRAAEILGINYRSLRHRLQKYGIGDQED